MAYRCVNAVCPGRLKESLQHYAGRHAMNIDGLGEKIVEQLVDKKIVKDFADLYSLKLGTVAELERMAEKSAQNLLDEIAASKKNSLDRLINGLGLHMVGERTAELLAEHFGSIEKIADASLEELSEVPEVGPKVGASIREFFDEPANLKMLKRLREAGVNPKVERKSPEEQQASRADIRLHRRPSPPHPRRGRRASSSPRRQSNFLSKQEDQLRGSRHRPRLKIRQSQRTRRLDPRRGSV